MGEINTTQVWAIAAIIILVVAFAIWWVHPVAMV